MQRPGCPASGVNYHGWPTLLLEGETLPSAENPDAEGLRTRNGICKGNFSRSGTDVPRKAERLS